MAETADAREQEERESFFEAFSHETDRGMAIVAVCYLDNILEKLIRAAYIQDPKVSSLFRNNQVLHAFYNKICIAYFSGLIPQAVYDDLILVAEIRNKFAHGILANLKFSDETIAKRIDKFQQLPPEAKHKYPPRLKYMLIVSHLGAFLRDYRDVLLEMRITRPVELPKPDVYFLQRCILTPHEIEELVKKRAENREDSK